MRTICVPSKTLCRPNLMVANGDIWFFTERDWNQECCHGNSIVGVIQFLLRCTLLVPSLRNATLMFLELFSIECCAVFVEPSTPKRKKDIPKRKTTFFLTLKSLSNKQQLFFLLYRRFKTEFFFQLGQKPDAQIDALRKHKDTLCMFSNASISDSISHAVQLKFLLKKCSGTSKLGVLCF